MPSSVANRRALKLPQNVSESVKRRNPELYGGLGAMVPVEREQGAPDALVQSPRPQRQRKSRLEIIVTIIVCRRRLMDDDNSQAGGVKALRDAIAASLGIDDGDKRIRFQYAQAQTVGEQGCIVKIERP